MDFDEFVAYMADDDPGAAMVLQAMYAADAPRMSCALHPLDAAGIRGQYLWVAYQHVCDMNVKKLFEAIESGNLPTELEKHSSPWCKYKAKK